MWSLLAMVSVIVQGNATSMGEGIIIRERLFLQPMNIKHVMKNDILEDIDIIEW